MKVALASCFKNANEVELMLDTTTNEFVVRDHRLPSYTSEARFGVTQVLRTMVRFGFNLKNII